MSDPFTHYSLPETLLFEASSLEDAPDLYRLNQSALDWICGTLDTGTYQDILEEVGEVKDPEQLIQVVEYDPFSLEWF